MRVNKKWIKLYKDWIFFSGVIAEKLRKPDDFHLRPKIACVPKYYISKPCIYIKDERLNNGIPQKVKWGYAEAIKKFGCLLTLEEKRKFSNILKKFSTSKAKALLLNGFAS